MLIKNKLLISAICAGFFLSGCAETEIKKTEPVAVVAQAAVFDEAPSFTNPIIPNGADPWLQF